MGMHLQVIGSNLCVARHIGIGGSHLFIGPGIVIGGCESCEKVARVAEAARKPTSRIDLNFGKMTPPI
jgi:UDP-3-O-[3-hydroxymyristoyl] glucosamine N-acyltransferase